ncbi:hypothetical protein V1517DRAFT_318635 [Lipomyces orientalis]|uniref:Uncharacterized protein n=1 Tax=Lipomyces orientalis TaxID=1233043 RepID=A0ACC3TTL4_9ASCO
MNKPSTTAPPLQSSCVTCFKESPAYKCPACLARYCNVECFSTHKSRSGCPGMKDVKDAVLRYIPRTELIGRRGYSEATRSDAVVREDDTGEEEEERRKTQLLRDRDYNFLSLIERRVGVQRNIAQDVLRRGITRSRGRPGGRGRRGGRGRGSRGGRGVAESRANNVEPGCQSNEDNSGSSDDSDSDSSSDDSDESDEESTKDVSSKPRVLQLGAEDSDDDDDEPPEEASSLAATVVEDGLSISTGVGARPSVD